MSMKRSLGWGSHIPMLIKVMENTTGDVLEIGMGYYSTPLLHWICSDSKRYLHSYENIKGYFDLFQNGLNEYHKTYLVDCFNGVGTNNVWSVAFIDSNPMEERAHIALALADVAQIIIVHDSEHREERFYHYRELLNPVFKYRYDYTKFRPNTSVYSNFNTLEFLNE